ncbi:MAG: ATP-binding protein [Ignavibacteriales bacterium]
MENKIDLTNSVIHTSSVTNVSEAVDLFPASIFLIDKNFIIRNVNELSLGLINCEIDALIGSNINEFLDEESKEQFKIFFQKTSNTFEPRTAELILKKADGTKLNVLAILKFIINPTSNEQFCSIAMIDYTPQKMKEEIIKDSEIRFKSLANTAPVMIWISDVEGLFSFVNKIWLDFTGGEIGEQLGLNWLRHVHPEDLEKFVENYQKCINSQSQFTFEFRLKGKNNEYEWMLIKGKPRFSSEKIFMGFIGSCFSITDQKEIEAKVTKINSELIELNATKDKFFSIISHDLRSPLSGLMGILEILETSYDSLEETEMRAIVAEAFRTSKTTYALIENLLEWSRIQTGKLTTHREQFNISALVNDIAALYDNKLKNKKIDFNTEIDANLNILADKAMTETILRNLISNAIKFTSRTGTLKVSAEMKEDLLIMKVEDSGIGIDEKKISNLFRVEVNYSTKGTEQESGTGLGLIICKELVEKQGGKIWVESKKNEGSVFYFTIPVTK